MSNDFRFLESSATPEEDSYNYRVEWDDLVLYHRNAEHKGPGSVEIGGFDNAWDYFCDCKKSMLYKGLRLIRIDLNGVESVYANG